MKFNLAQLNKLIVEAMGAIPYSGRDWDNEYTIWDVEKPTEKVAELELNDSSLQLVITEAQKGRQNAVTKTMDFYGVNNDDANKMCRSFIAYKPAYFQDQTTEESSQQTSGKEASAIIIYIAPHVSRGYIHGIEHKEEAGDYHFYLGTFTKVQMSPSQIEIRAKGRLENKFNATFENLGLTLDDLKFVVKGTPPDGSRNFVVTGEIPNLNPEKGKYTSLFVEDQGLAAKETEIQFNNNGFDKFLRFYVGPWYEKALINPPKPKSKQARTYDSATDRALSKIVDLEREAGRKFTDEEKNKRWPMLIEEGKQELLKQMLGDEANNREPNEDLMSLVYKKTSDLLGADVLLAEQGNQAAKILVDKVKIPVAKIDPVTKKIYTEVLSGRMPNQSDHCFKAKYGSQQSSAQKQSTKTTINHIKLVNEIQRFRYDDKGMEKPAEQIARDLNKTRQGRKPFNQNNVEMLIREINSNPSILYGGQSAQVKELATGVSGSKSTSSANEFTYHPSLSSALHEAQIKFSTATETDPVTKAILIERPSDRNMEVFSTDRDFSWNELKELRQEEVVKQQEKLLPEAKEDFEIEDKDAIPTEQEEMAEKPGVKEVVDEGVQQGQYLHPEPQIPEEPEEKPRERPRVIDVAKEQNRKIIVSTLKSLIKIAEDLDNEGNDDAAEEVHKVIRKYQGRI